MGGAAEGSGGYGGNAGFAPKEPARLHVCLNDPWRAACPSCDGRSIEPNTGRAINRPDDARDARCCSCGWRGDRVVDYLSGELVSVFGRGSDYGADC